MTIVRIHVALLIGSLAVLLDPATASAATTDHGFVGESAKVVIFILGGIAIAAVAAAAFEVTFRTVREGKWSEDTAPVLSAPPRARYAACMRVEPDAKARQATTASPASSIATSGGRTCEFGPSLY